MAIEEVDLLGIENSAVLQGICRRKTLRFSPSTHEPARVTRIYWWQGTGIIQRTHKKAKIVNFRTISFPAQEHANEEYSLMQAVINYSQKPQSAKYYIEDYRFLPFDDTCRQLIDYVLESWIEQSNVLARNMKNMQVPYIVAPIFRVESLVQAGLGLGVRRKGKEHDLIVPPDYSPFLKLPWHEIESKAQQKSLVDKI